MENVLVIGEFMVVFPEELPKLPPNREIEFHIDTILGTNPISMPPYRMALVELKGTEGAAARASGQGFHLAKYFTLGCFCSICEEEGWIFEVMY